MKRSLLSLAFIMATSLTLTAQDQPNAFRRWDINLNVVSFTRLEGVNAWGSQLGFVFRFNPTVGIVADFDGHQNSQMASTWLYGYRVGPRLYGHYGHRLTAGGGVVFRFGK